jgi:hypothetical protein
MLFKSCSFLPFYTADSSGISIALSLPLSPSLNSKSPLITMSAFHDLTHPNIINKTAQAFLAMVIGAICKKKACPCQEKHNCILNLLTISCFHTYSLKVNLPINLAHYFPKVKEDLLQNIAATFLALDLP